MRSRPRERSSDILRHPNVALTVAPMRRTSNKSYCAGMIQLTAEYLHGMGIRHAVTVRACETLLCIKS